MINTIPNLTTEDPLAIRILTEELTRSINQNLFAWILLLDRLI